MSSLVVKLGSSIVADDRGDARRDVLGRICDELAELHRAGHEVVVATSGAIAPGMGGVRTGGATPRGMGVVQLAPSRPDAVRPRPRSIDELQAASAVGQGKLYQVYDELLRARGITSAQILLTFFDMSARTHYLNARQTLRKLLGGRGGA